MLSAARFETYLAAAGGDRSKALLLYMWNAKVSAAFVNPLHLAEIAVRNAVSGAIGSAYRTVDWHVSQTFASDLKDPQRGYSPRKDLNDSKAEALRDLEAAEAHRHKIALRQARIDRLPPPVAKPGSPPVPVGKVVAELKFVFWVSMLTASHQSKIWDDQLSSAFPNLLNADGTDPEVEAARASLHGQVDAIRGFRNRVAHHEPLLRLDLAQVLRRIIEVVGWQCCVKGSWLQQEQEVSRLIELRPS